MPPEELEIELTIQQQTIILANLKKIERYKRTETCENALKKLQEYTGYRQTVLDLELFKLAFEWNDYTQITELKSAMDAHIQLRCSNQPQIVDAPQINSNTHSTAIQNATNVATANVSINNTNTLTKSSKVTNIELTICKNVIIVVQFLTEMAQSN